MLLVAWVSTRGLAASAGEPGSVPVGAAAPEIRPEIRFGTEVVPLLTKLGCNAGGCHGKASGQNGFKLSLLGFEPEFDFAAVVKEARGRRIFAAAPESSLLLLKAIGAVPHGGGRRLQPDSYEYEMLLRWI